MNQKYYILSDAHLGTMCNYMLADLHQHPDVVFFFKERSPVCHKNKVFGKLSSIIYRLRWELKKRQFLKMLCTPSPDTDRWLILPNEVTSAITVAELQKLEAAGIHIAALLIDPIRANYSSAVHTKQMLNDFSFHKIITFDPIDAQEQGWCYTNTLYSRFPVSPVPVDQDLFYIGNVKDRMDTCKELFHMFEKHHVKASFKLSCTPQQAQELPADVVLRQRIPYNKMLQLLQSCRCILDITQPDQSGITLRYYEAVVFNKKLLTNNRNITQLPFYDPRYMKFYDTVDDIDWQWIKSDDMPDYHYDGRFSSVHLLELLN